MMFAETENKSPLLASRLLFAWASMIAAGLILVAWQSGEYFFSSDFLSNHFGWYLLGSFLNITACTSFFVYIYAKENRLLQTLFIFGLTPVFIVAFVIATVFISEMFYGGSGYHGEYAFPFLQRQQF